MLELLLGVTPVLIAYAWRIHRDFWRIRVRRIEDHVIEVYRRMLSAERRRADSYRDFSLNSGSYIIEGREAVVVDMRLASHRRYSRTAEQQVEVTFALV